MRICILHIGHTEPNEVPKFPPSPQRFRSVLEPLMPTAKWQVISAVKGTLPNPQNFDAYLITGGKFSVFEELDWQDRLFGFIRDVHRARVPMIGICYGHQAITFALGGRVERSDKGWGVGLMTVSVSDGITWPDQQSNLMLHAMHQDQVTSAPEGADIFLSSDFCPISGFTLDNFLCIQQHPDFTPDINRDLILKRRDRIGDRSDVALNSLAGRDDTLTTVKWMAEFLERTAKNA